MSSYFLKGPWSLFSRAGLTHGAVADAEHGAHAAEAADERTSLALQAVRLDLTAAGAHHEQRPAAAAHQRRLLLRRDDVLGRQRVAVIDVHHVCCGEPRKSCVNKQQATEKQHA